MMGLRIGQGYDVHRLTENRPLVLGGVTIPYGRGLDGHSDADVLIHAVMDALLGAAHLGDIGMLFPDSEPAYRNIASTILLSKVSTLLVESGWRVVNVDSTIVAQAPRLSPYRTAMEENIAHCLGLSPEQVSVKATTEERLGFTGSGDGIAAQAVTLLERL